MNVTDAVDSRVSVRAFLPRAVEGALVHEILDKARRAPSGGNVQPWKVYALAGSALTDFKALISQRSAAGQWEGAGYAIYPNDLWEPHRTYRFQCGEDMYRCLGIPREDKPARLAHLARNLEFFGAPVGLFFFLDRRMGPPQWSDLGMFMQTVMLLAKERGLDTCAQEFWSMWSGAVAEFVKAPSELMLFSGMCLGYRDPQHSVNSLRTSRAPFADVVSMLGFDG